METARSFVLFYLLGANKLDTTTPGFWRPARNDVTPLVIFLRKNRKTTT